jgi:hypothetical protein
MKGYIIGDCNATSTWEINESALLFWSEANKNGSDTFLACCVLASFTIGGGGCVCIGYNWESKDSK